MSVERELRPIGGNCYFVPSNLIIPATGTRPQSITPAQLAEFDLELVFLSKSKTLSVLLKRSLRLNRFINEISKPGSDLNLYLKKRKDRAFLKATQAMA